MAIFQLIYVSSATALFSRAELDVLLSKSRANNELLGVTGIMLYKDGNFIQVLEGEEAAVTALYATISNDERHKGTIVLAKSTVSARDFSEWSMGFRDLNRSDVQAIPGFNEFMNVPLTDVSNPSRSMKLIRLFRAKM